ncbi:unnamed protein product, partial [Pocillopora meandrina]
MYLKELFPMNKVLELRTELRDLHFSPSNVKTGNPISSITIVIPSFASFISSSKQRKSIFLSAVFWGDVSEISNNGWQGEECTWRSGLALRLQFTYNSFSYQGVIGYLSSLIWNQPQLAVFFAYFPHEERPDSQDILYLICCPSQLKEKVRAEITNQANAPTSSDSDSRISMIPGRDRAYVSLIGGIRAIEEDDMDEFYLQIIFNRFISDDVHKVQVPIRVIDDKGLSGVRFFKTPKFEKGTLLCRLNFR